MGPHGAHLPNPKPPDGLLPNWPLIPNTAGPLAQQIPNGPLPKATREARPGSTLHREGLGALGAIIGPKDKLTSYSEA